MSCLGQILFWGVLILKIEKTLIVQYFLQDLACETNIVAILFSLYIANMSSLILSNDFVSSTTL